MMRRFLKPKQQKNLRIIDIGGIGREKSRQLPGWGGDVRLLTVNLFDEADIRDDATRLNTIEDNSLDGIYSSHLIEHFPPQQLDEMLSIWIKKIKRNGRLEVKCPDIEWLMRKMLSDKRRKDLWENVLIHSVYGAAATPEHEYYQKPGQYHLNILWEDRLRRCLEYAGFVRVRRLHYFREKFDFWFYDLALKKYHNDKIKIKDLVMEAYKP